MKTYNKINLTMIKNKKIQMLSLIFCLVTINLTAQLNLIPYPNSVELNDGVFKFKKLSVQCDAGLENELKSLQESMNDLGVDVVESNDPNVELLLDGSLSDELGAEGYKLDIDKNTVRIVAAESAGVFYGVQTLEQLVTLPTRGKAFFPCLTIQDAPAFKWRAFMMDESRHFKGKEVVFGMLDQMSKLKMNIFHWHLTDDQGWRIEIKKYPLLTEVGGTRKDTQMFGVYSPQRTGEVHSGFYTQDEIREVIAYAATKNITIIPEIEMPGHASAAIAAYPWLGTLEEPIDVPVTFGILPNIYNVSNERVYNFIEDVLQEVIDLFPSKIVHIGGDEVKFGQWEDNVDVKKYMEENDLKTYQDVQISFTNNISQFVESNGFRMMGWNDILGENIHQWKDSVDTHENKEKLATSAIIHFWKGNRELMVSALEKGHDVVNSQHSYTYLDYSLNSVPVGKAYKFNPIPEDIDPSLESHVIGLGCQMWSEWIPTVENMYGQVFPRLAAYAEVGWTSQENKDFKRFQTSLETVKNNWEQTPYFKPKSKNPDYVDLTFLVDMNGSSYFKDVEGGREMLTLSGTFTNPLLGTNEHWHAGSVALTDYDYDGIYTGTKSVPKNSSLLFILLKSPHGSWDGHTKILVESTCENINSEKNYMVEIGEADLEIKFKAGQCLE